jgi:serine/threonine protein kinase
VLRPGGVSGDRGSHCCSLVFQDDAHGRAVGRRRHRAATGVMNVNVTPCTRSVERQILRQEPTLAGYTVSKFLGEGSFGSVVLAQDRSTGEDVAIKVINKAGISTVGSAERVSREFFLLICLNHENVIRLLAVGTS